VTLTTPRPGSSTAKGGAFRSPPSTTLMSPVVNRAHPDTGSTSSKSWWVVRYINSHSLDEIRAKNAALSTFKEMGRAKQIVSEATLPSFAKRRLRDPARLEAKLGRGRACARRTRRPATRKVGARWDDSKAAARKAIRQPLRRARMKEIT